MATSQPYVLVTGATGFIGAHVVDNLLSRGIKVRAATRSLQKGEQLLTARPQHSSHLDIVQISDFSSPTSLTNAVKDITGIIHVASPFSYTTTNNEKELILPAIAGVHAVLSAASSEPTVKRIVITSSFASVLNADRKPPPRFTYNSSDWNPLTYAESISPTTSAVIAYRGSKKFAELAAWEFVERENPSFDVVTLCPPMTFGPVRHPVSDLASLNESNANLWKVASGESLPVSRVPFWVDVRDLAMAHVEALLRPEAGGKRFIVASPETFSYSLVADIVAGAEDEFPWGKERVARGEKQDADGGYDLDGETAGKALGLKYTPFEKTVKDFVRQAVGMEEREKAS